MAYRTKQTPRSMLMHKIKNAEWNVRQMDRLLSDDKTAPAWQVEARKREYERWIGIVRELFAEAERPPEDTSISC